jgi:N-acetylglutamate synthase-like GNAT family acetyltransferase
MENFKVTKLSEEHTEASYNLLNKMIGFLKDSNQQGFLLPKSKENIAYNIKNNIVLGVFHNGVLIAEGTIKKLKSDDSKGSSSDSDIPNMCINNVKNEDICLVGSLCVSPEFQGLGLGKLVRTELLELNQDKVIVSQIAINNKKSVGNCLGTGAYLMQQTFDPFDNENVYYLIKSNKKFNMDDKVITIPFENKVEIVKALNKGYVGIELHGDYMILAPGKEIKDYFGCHGVNCFYGDEVYQQLWQNSKGK